MPSLCRRFQGPFNFSCKIEWGRSKEVKGGQRTAKALGKEAAPPAPFEFGKKIERQTPVKAHAKGPSATGCRYRPTLAGLGVLYKQHIRATGSSNPACGVMPFDGWKSWSVFTKGRLGEPRKALFRR